MKDHGALEPQTDRMTGWPAVAVWLVMGVPVVLGLASAIVVPEDPDALPLWALAIFVMMAASLGAVGALLVTRQPRNAVGWILWISSITVSVSLITSEYTSLAVAGAAALPATTLVAWLSQFGLAPAITCIVVFIPLLFPDGRFLTRRWRWAAVLGGLVLVVVIVRNAFAPGALSDYPSIQNPFGITQLETLRPIIEVVNGPGVVIAAGLAAWSTVLRYRRGSLVERAQIRWFGAATGFTLTMFTLSVLGDGALADFGWIGGIMSLSLIPIAVGIAILRYRLYDIDRIISRTVGWGLVTGILVAVFAGLVVALQAVLAPVTNENTLAVAASTLVAFALFQPLRRRVQRAVDRRFDRARYDGQHTMDAFAERLRAQTNIDAVLIDLAGTAGSAVSPASTGIWLRTTEGAR